MDAIDEIKRLYYAATQATIQKDIERAIDLLKSLSSEEERERAAVYMDGLSQMRSEWSAVARPTSGERRRDGVTTSSLGSRPSASARPTAAPRGRSGRSKSSSRRSP